MAFLRRAVAITIIAMFAAGFSILLPRLEKAEASQALPATSSLLPPASAVSGWQMREAPRTYNTENLYEYIDGNMDLFMAYGFLDLAVGDYTPIVGQEHAPAPHPGWISVDIYNMGTPLQAFGIFGAEKPTDTGTGTEDDSEPVPVRGGAQGYRTGGTIVFWKGQYCVKVSLIEGEDSAAAMKLAEATAASIGGDAAMPAELARLPVESRIAGSERYVKKNGLGHRFLLEMVSAAYDIEKANLTPLSPSPSTEKGDKGERVTLYVADLGSAEKAAEGLAKLREFEATTGEVADASGRLKPAVPAFGARDAYYGEMVAAQAGRFLVIGVSEQVKREAVEELVKAGVGSVR